jgi:hypothetical protein
MQIQGLATRWSDLPAAKEANRLLIEYDNKADRSWEKEDIAEQRRFLLAEARGFDAYASGELPKQYEGQRADMAAAALDRWRTLLADDAQSPAGQEARKRIPELMKLAGEEK